MGPKTASSATIEATPDAAPDLRSYLSLFGLDRFRPGQQDVIRAVLAGQDCLCVMPTGGGKSLCYQLPAVSRDGLTLVVSPLIALMKDQVDSLRALGLRATFINSTLPLIEQQSRLEGMSRGQFDLVYVVPERFRNPRFIEAVKASNLQLIAVDEAHCVSEWGHDFRPDYARLGRYRAELGYPPTIALTATATAAVRQDVVELLRLREPALFVTGFSRPNLHYQVRHVSTKRAKQAALVELLRQYDGPSIIYAATRAGCEEIAEAISGRSQRRVAVYHAGLPPDDRRRAQDALMNDQVDVIVATNAFGMGIDKPDIRLVVHYNLPSTIEAYYQESGRAGRDGQPARCILLYSRTDRRIQEFFIDSAYPPPDTIEAVYDFLRRLDDDPIEMTQQDVTAHLNLGISADGIGNCEQMLEKAGVLERLEPCQNMAIVQINSDQINLVDLLPQQAKTQRKVLRAIEQIVGPRRGELVYFNRRELLKRSELDSTALGRALIQLRSLKPFDYVPPFRGRAIRMLQRETPFEKLDIDFEVLRQRRAADYAKLESLVRYAEGGCCRQQSVLHYFGEVPGDCCNRCDNCDNPQGPPEEIRILSAGDEAVVEAVRMVLSGAARAKGRFGRRVIALMLCGSNSQPVRKHNLDKLSTFGLLEHLHQDETVLLVDALIAAGLLLQTTDTPERPLVQITPSGKQMMRGRAPKGVALSLPSYLFDKLRAGYHARTAGEDDTTTGELPPATAREENIEPAVVAAEEDDPPLVKKIYKTLRAWRERTAAVADLPLHYVLTNETLRIISESQPSDAEALLAVKGIGEARLGRYGEELLKMVADVADGKTPVAGSQPNDLHMPSEAKRPTTPPEKMPSVTAGSEPNHYWTWRMLFAGLSPRECASARAVDLDDVVAHAVQAIDSGWPVRPEWFFSDEELATLAKAIGPDEPKQMRPLLAKLPASLGYAEVQLFLKCRRQEC